MKIEVPHSKDSEDYIKEVLSRYTEVDEPIYKTKGRCAIHMYPFEDTMIDGKDNLNGYVDAYLCELHIYDILNKTVYKHKYSDSVFNDVNCNVRIFKDLSTLLTFEKPISINYGIATFIYPITE